MPNLHNHISKNHHTADACDLGGISKLSTCWLTGKDHPDTLTRIYTLANLYHKQNRLDEASDLHGNALDGFRKLLGSSHRTTIVCEGDDTSSSKEIAVTRRYSRYC